MTTLDDLRETLDQHAGQVPLDAALLPDVRTRAAGLRRRRRMLHGTALVVALVMAAVTIPWAVRSAQRTPVAGHSVAPTLWQTGITLREGSKYQIRIRQSDTVAQYVQVHGKGDGDAVEVLALDAGAFDPAALRRGEPVAIGGPQAWYVASYTPEVAGISVIGPVIGWKDAATGAWVLVIGYSEKKKAGMVEVARDVRLAGNVEEVSPVSFGWVPPELRAVQTDVDTGPGVPSASFGLGYGGEQGAVGILAFRNVLPFRFEATLKVEDKDWSNFERDLAGRTPKVINGAQTWYLPGPNKIFTPTPNEGADMVVAAGNCQIGMHVTDRNRITEADLDRMLGSATFGDCANASGWRPALG
ncbi:hypothetical protein [Actinoplanes sp. NPDC051411]|uniref:hypothetical protein n=1 Tax=Actinoplanes sp. NPDC051411 TaxID=3155522 RepID=UPI0034177025